MFYSSQTTTDNNGAISDADHQWLADNGGIMPISEIPSEDKALVGTGTGAVAQMAGNASQVGTIQGSGWDGIDQLDHGTTFSSYPILFGTLVPNH